MKKQKDDVLEFLRAFIAGGSQQDFKLWAGELYQKLYRTADESRAVICDSRDHRECTGDNCVWSDLAPNRPAEPADDFRALLSEAREAAGVEVLGSDLDERIQSALNRGRKALSTEIYIRGPFTILCNYCGKTFGKVDEHTEVAASVVLQCPCGQETKFLNMLGPASRTTTEPT